MHIPLVDLKTQYRGIKDEVLAEVGKALDGMQLYLGKNVQAFEAGFASYCGTKFAIGVGSGTDALYIALRALGIGPGDEVITVAHTFIATVEAIIMTGARPVLVDIDPDTYTIDVNQIEPAITKRTKAIIPVHLYGHPADMDPILEIARKYKLKVVEDSCQGHGAEYKGKRAGSLGDAGCFSFYFSKNLGAYGESGMVTTSDPEVARRCRMIREHGQSQKYYHAMMGVNSRMDEIQAAVLNIKLPHLDGWLEKRRNIARILNTRLPQGLKRPTEMSGAKHVYHLYVVRAPDRERLRVWMEGKGVNVGIHYPVPIHLQEAWKSYGGGDVSLPVTEKIVGEILSLPIYPEMTIEEVDYMVDCIKEFDESRQTMVLQQA